MYIRDREHHIRSQMQKLENGIAVKQRLPIFGDVCGIPIVFIHGSGFDASVFNTQFKSKILAHHHLIAVDLLGHGQSDNAANPAQDYSYANMGKTILEALELMGTVPFS